MRDMYSTPSDQDYYGQQFPDEDDDEPESPFWMDGSLEDVEPQPENDGKDE